MAWKYCLPLTVGFYLFLLPGCSPEDKQKLSEVEAESMVENHPVTPADKQQWFAGPMAYDAGKVEEGKKITRSFTFKNPGPEPCNIISLRKNCACAYTTIKYKGRVIKAVSPLVPPLVVAPGESGSIEVMLDTTGIDGLKEAMVLVQTADPRYMWMRLSVKAESMLFFWPEPRKSGLGEIGSADQAEFSFLIKSKRVKHWQLTRCEVPSTYRVEYHKTTWGGRDAWWVKGVIGPGLPPGNHSATLVCYTDSGGKKISYPVKISVRAPWEVDPPGGFNFGQIKRGRKKSLKFVVRTLTLKRKLKIKSLRLSQVNQKREHFRIMPRVTIRDRRYDVTFTALETLPPGSFMGCLLVCTSDPDQPQKKIPFHGFVR